MNINNNNNSPKGFKERGRDGKRSYNVKNIEMFTFCTSILLGSICKRTRSSDQLRKVAWQSGNLRQLFIDLTDSVVGSQIDPTRQVIQKEKGKRRADETDGLKKTKKKKGKMDDSTSRLRKTKKKDSPQ